MRKLTLLILASLLFLLVACPTTPPDKEKPTLSITAPTEGVTVDKASLTVTGTAKDNVAVTKLTIKVNDGAASDITSTLQGDTFSTEVTLKEGSNTIIVTASDAAGNEFMRTRNVTFRKAQIAGHIWLDANGNAQQDNGEPSLAERTVFLDTNNNGILDAGEASVKTDANGYYAFTNLTPGTYHVNQVLAFGESFAASSSSANLSESVHEVVLEQDRATSRIVGGIDANIADFPFMLALGVIRSGSFRQFCGATLISSRYALTAAHCVESELPTLSVLIGTDTLNNNSGTVIRATPVSHPKYDGDTAHGYDIAVLELATPVDLSKHYTVEMVDDSTVQFTNTDTIATATGWGALASGSRGSARLQVVHTKIFDSAACQTAYTSAGAELENFDTQICAGVPEGGVDGCQGDSGGPLFVRGELNGQKRWFHAGATSWGYGCAWKGFPGIWARTSVLRNWIISQAVEKSSSQKVVLSDGSSFDNINFANSSTVRPFINDIEPRWQTTNFTLTTDNRGFFVEPNKDLAFAWNIFAEAGASYNYTCTFTIEKRGLAPASETRNVPCALGANAYNFVGGIDQGTRIFSLEVEANNIKQNRQRPAGLLAHSITGELADTDPKDPDYTKTYYIDYFDLTGLTVGDEVTFVLETTKFSPYLVLYDKSKRDPQSGGGGITYGRSSITFKVEAGVEYLVGVTTGREKQTGAYTLLTSSGTLTSFTYPTP